MSIYNISVAELKTWLDAKKVILLDVREQEEYNAEHIADSYFIPLSNFNFSAVEKITKDNPDKNLVIYCRSGKRSLTACDFLKQSGMECDLWNLEPGILGWKAKGEATIS